MKLEVEIAHGALLLTGLLDHGAKLLFQTHESGKNKSRPTKACPLMQVLRGALARLPSDAG